MFSPNLRLYIPGVFFSEHLSNNASEHLPYASKNKTTKTKQNEQN